MNIIPEWLTNYITLTQLWKHTGQENYRPNSLRPTFGKIFDRVLYNSIFNYFLNNKLFTSSQSGFSPEDLCISQILPIIHEIQKSFNNLPGNDVMGVFLNISKALKHFLFSY